MASSDSHEEPVPRVPKRDRPRGEVNPEPKGGEPAEEEVRQPGEFCILAGERPPAGERPKGEWPPC